LSLLAGNRYNQQVVKTISQHGGRRFFYFGLRKPTLPNHGEKIKKSK
jgi:hypothetical protein